MYLLYTSHLPSIPPFLINTPFQKKNFHFYQLLKVSENPSPLSPPLMGREELITMRSPFSPFNKRGGASNNNDIHAMHVNNLTLLLKQMISYANL